MFIAAMVQKLLTFKGGTVDNRCFEKRRHKRWKS